MKQTAVEWLANSIIYLEERLRLKEINLNDFIEEKDLLLEQAKAIEKEQKIAFGKKCFYKGFEKAENDDANCFTAWREEAPELLTFKSE